MIREYPYVATYPTWGHAPPGKLLNSKPSQSESDFILNKFTYACTICM